MLMVQAQATGYEGQRSRQLEDVQDRRRLPEWGHRTGRLLQRRPVGVLPMHQDDEMLLGALCAGALGVPPQRHRQGRNLALHHKVCRLGDTSPTRKSTRLGRHWLRNRTSSRVACSSSRPKARGSFGPGGRRSPGGR
jgi:hypothetical protein